MPRIATPSVSPTINRGKQYFRVAYPTATGRKREIYSTRKKADDRLRAVLADAKAFGDTADAVTATQRADAAAALAILDGNGSLVEAARFFIADIMRRKSGKPIAEAVAAFMRSRENMSAQYVRSLRPRLRFISSFLAGKTTAGIETQDVQQLLDSVAGTAAPMTVGHYRSTLSAFFRFCKRRNWCSDILTDGATIPTQEDEEVQILTPAEAATVLSNCTPDILPGIVLGLFCGLRKSEIAKLDWKAVDLAQGHVTIGAAIAKTSSRRVCPVPENARAWLAPYAQESGILWPTTKAARGSWLVAAINSGFGPFGDATGEARKLQTDPATGKPRKDLRPWPANALRHSAITYKVASDKKKDLSRIAYESGNSPGIIQRHYNGLAKPENAKTFFSIMPTVAGNVTQFRAA